MRRAYRPRVESFIAAHPLSSSTLTCHGRRGFRERGAAATGTATDADTVTVAVTDTDADTVTVTDAVVGLWTWRLMNPRE
jgi:hypothetical protein